MIFLAVLFVATQIADACFSGSSFGFGSNEKYKHKDCVSRKNIEQSRYVVIFYNNTHT